MDKLKSLKILYLGLSIVYVFPLYFFYMKYVPLVKAFQIVLLPILIAVLVTTALSLSRGIVLFVFLFPLINGLPYFFGISEHTPHAPAALVLFLFFLWGWLIIRGFRGPQESIKTPIHRPMFFFAAVVIISGIFTFLKFSNFFPFRSDGIYELMTNVSGVSAGGALMSALFSSLNYLTGFLFFLIVVSALKSDGFASKILLALLSSTGLACLFGLYQHFFDNSFGNTDFWVLMEQINATFKDPNSFGLFLAALLPLAIAVGLTEKGIRRVLAFGISGLFLFIFPQVGMRSGFLALVVALLLFTVLAIAASKERLKILLKKRTVWAGASLLVIFLAAFGIGGLRDTRLFDKIRNYSQSIFSIKDWARLSPERYFLWNEAIEMMKDFPLSGVGIGSYIVELPNYYTLDPQENEAVLAGYRRIDSAENYFLHVGAEMGLIGIFFALWLFLAVAVQTIKAVRNKKGLHSRLMSIGIAAGVLAYFVNLIFHSFIGSFEVNYLFWLGIAVLFVPGGKEGESDNKVRTQRPLAVLGVGLLVLFGVVYLWHSSRGLSLKSRTELFGIEQMFGLYGLEETGDGRPFRWSEKAAGLTLTIEKPNMYIPLLASHPDISKNPVFVRIYLVTDFFREKRLLEELTISENSWHTHQYDLSEEVGLQTMILIKVSRTWSPLKTSGIPDARRLGVAVGAIEFK